jgi:nucleotidyltransferase/DNA polymerase involved in DNA repair
MGFSSQDKTAMLQLKGVGHTVISRLEQLGFSSLMELAEVNPMDITQSLSHITKSTCWHNSPQARNAIQAIITLAKQIHLLHGNSSPEKCPS